VQRREVLVALLSGCVGIAVPFRRALACGQSAEHADEEYFDEHGGSSAARELARHWVEVNWAGAPLARRLAVSPDGAFCAVSDRAVGVFRLFGKNGQTGTVPAPQGGTATFLPSSRVLLLSLEHGEYVHVVLVKPETAEYETWGEFLDARGIVLGPGGVLVSHARPASGGAAVTLALGDGRIENLVRGERPGMLATRGNRVAMFDGERVKVFDVEERQPHDWGALPSAATHVLWNADRLLAICATGLHVLEHGRKPRLVLGEPNLHTLFSHGTRVMCASRRGAWSVTSDARVVLTAPRENLTQVSAIAGSDDLLVVRGASVRRLVARRGLGGTVARGRDGFHLRGALSWNRGVVTWSSRRWLLTEGGGCSAVRPPVAYLVD
jgi:hypothetical protein